MQVFLALDGREECAVEVGVDDTVADLYAHAAAELQADRKARLYVREDDGELRLLKDRNETVRDVGLADGAIVHVRMTLQAQAIIHLRDRHGIVGSHPAYLIDVFRGRRTDEDLELLRLLLQAGVMSELHAHENPLFAACASGWRAAVQVCLDEGLDPACLSRHAKTPMFLAASKGHTDVVCCLAEHVRFDGACVLLQRQRARNTPLEAAADGGYLDCVRALLRYGADCLNPVGFAGYGVPMFFAAAGGHVDIVRCLAEHVEPDDVHVLANAAGHAIGAADTSLLTPLMAAARHGHLDCVRALLRYGADKNVRQAGRTPAMMAAYNKHAAVMAELLSPDSATQEDDTGRTLLALCLQPPHGVGALRASLEDETLACVQAAVAAAEASGVQPLTELVNKAGQDSRTPLMLAAAYGSANAVRLLLASGACLDCADNRGDTAVAAVCEATARGGCPNHEDHLPRATQALDALLEAGADPDTTNHNGDSPLALLCRALPMKQSAAEPLVARLVRAGVDCARRNDKGETPLTLAARAGFWQAVQMLPDPSKADV